MAQLFLRAGRRSFNRLAPTPGASTFIRTPSAALSTTTDIPIPNLTTPPPPSTAGPSPPEPKASSSTQTVTRIIPAPSRPPRQRSLLTDGAPNTELYSVGRTPSKFLPIYHEGKRGGNLKITSVKKVTGDVETLRKQLEGFLTPRPEYVRINSVTGHVVMKGWYKTQIENFLSAKGF